MEEIKVPKFVLDRETIGALNAVRKLLKGKEITGMERLEKLEEY